VSGKSRLDRLSPELSARERAILAARALNADEEPDRSILWTMPGDQAAEYNELVTMVNGVFRGLLPHALRLEAEAQVMKRELGMLSLLAVWGAERRMLAETALMAFDRESKKLSKSLATARDELRERYGSELAPRGPEVLLPALAEAVGFEVPCDVELTPFDQAVVGLAKRLETQIPVLRSWLMTLEQAVGGVVRALDESAIPPGLSALIASTHELIDAPEGADLYLGQLPKGEIDEGLAAQLAEKLRDSSTSMTWTIRRWHRSFGQRIH
jgi:hypothetical protein